MQDGSCRFFEDTVYVRRGGSPEELRCAKYLRDKLSEMGLCAEIVPFEIPMANMHRAVLSVDGVQISCEGYLCSGSADLDTICPTAKSCLCAGARARSL